MLFFSLFVFLKGIYYPMFFGAYHEYKDPILDRPVWDVTSVFLSVLRVNLPNVKFPIKVVMFCWMCSLCSIHESILAMILYYMILTTLYGGGGFLGSNVHQYFSTG